MTQILPSSSFLVQKAQFNHSPDQLHENQHSNHQINKRIPTNESTTHESSTFHAPNTFELSPNPSLHQNSLISSESSIRKFIYTANECEFVISMFRQINVEANGMTEGQNENGTRRRKRRRHNLAGTHKEHQGEDTQNRHSGTARHSDGVMQDVDDEKEPQNQERVSEGEESAENYPMASSERSSPFHQEPFHFQSKTFHLLKLTPSLAVWSTRNRCDVLICHNMRFFVLCAYFEKVRFVRVEELVEQARRQVILMERNIGER